MTAVSQAEFARMKRVSRKSVTEWKKQGRLVMSGNLVDVEASQQKLRNGSGHRAVMRRGPVTRDACISGKVTDCAPQAAAYADGACYGNPANLPDQPITVSVDINVGAGNLARIIGRHMPMPLVREMVSEWIRLQLDGLVGHEGDAEEEWPAPPVGLTTWAHHPLFDPAKLAPSELEWRDIEDGIAEWKCAHPGERSA